MALAEQAKLEILLQLKDQVSGGVAKAEAELKGLNATATGATTQLGRTGAAFRGASAHAISFGGALSHAKGAIGGLLSGPLGLIGLGAGLFSVGKFLTDAVSSTEDFGFATNRMVQLVGGSAESASALLAAAQKYGIAYDRMTQIAGFTEKTLGKLSEATAKSSKADKSAALQTLEAEKLRRQAAGESTKRINKLISEQKAVDALAAKRAGALPSETKLVALQKEYGVVLTDSKGKALDFQSVLFHVADAFKAASTAADKAKVASLAATVFGRGYATLVPILALGSKGLKDAEEEARLLGVTLNKNTIVQLAKAREAGRGFEEAMQGLKLAIGTEVIPVITDIQKALTDFLRNGGIAQLKSAFHDGVEFAKTFGGAVIQTFGIIKQGWDLIPPDFRKLLLVGFGANKAVKVLFGFSGLDLLKTAFGGGGFFSRGSFANPMWVQQVGGANLGSGVLPVGVVSSLIAGAGLVAQPILNFLTAQDLAQRQGVSPADASNLPMLIQKGAETLADDFLSIFGLGSKRGKAMTVLTGMGQGVIGVQDPKEPRTRAIVNALDVLHKDFLAQLGILRHSTDPKAVAAAALAVAKDVTKGVGNVATTQGLIAELKSKLAAATDPAERKALQAAIKAVEGKLPGRIWIEKELAEAQKIAGSSETNARKLEDLSRIQRLLLAKSDTVAADRIVAAIRALGGLVAGGVIFDTPRGPGPEGHRTSPLPILPRDPNRNRRGGFTVDVRLRHSAKLDDSVHAQQERYGTTAVRSGATVTLNG